MDAQEFRTNGHALIELIADYIETIESRPVTSTAKPGDVRAQLPEHPPTEPESFDAVLADVQNIIVPGLTHWQHPNFFAYSRATRAIRRSSPNSSRPALAFKE